jgi:hypothetical protein
MFREKILGKKTGDIICIKAKLMRIHVNIFTVKNQQVLRSL